MYELLTAPFAAEQRKYEYFMNALAYHTIFTALLCNFLSSICFVARDVEGGVLDTLESFELGKKYPQNFKLWDKAADRFVHFHRFFLRLNIVFQLFADQRKLRTSGSTDFLGR